VARADRDGVATSLVNDHDEHGFAGHALVGCLDNPDRRASREVPVSTEPGFQNAEAGARAASLHSPFLTWRSA
jgi:hypothetical protein